MNGLEHPDITRCNRTGYPRKLEVYRCPICGEELESGQQVYIIGGEIVGCEECIRHEDACETIEPSEN